MTRAARADVELRAQTAKYRKKLKEAEKETKQFAKGVKGSLSSGFKGGFGALAGLGTAGGIADIAKDVFTFEESLTRLQIQAKGAADIDAIRATAERLALQLGVTRNSVVDAANALTNRLGASAASADKIEVLTQAHVASGAAMEDLALVALKLDKAFGLRSADEMREGLSALIEVGKAGSVPLNEMAVVIAQSGSQFAKFGKQGKEAAAELGALIQLAVAGGKAGGFGSAAEAGTGLRAFITQLEQSEMGLRAMGIKVKQVGADGNKQLRPMADILADIRKKNLVNKAVFTQVFGSSQARDFLAILLEQEDALRDLTRAGVESAATQEDAQAFANSSAGKMKRAWQGLRLEIEKVFTPERIESMVEAAEALGKGLAFVIDNWRLLLGAVLAVKAVGVGRMLLTWSRASRGLAGSLAGVAAEAAAAGAGLGGIPGAPGAPTAPTARGGRVRGAIGKVASAVGPELALAGGFAVGQMIGEGIVADKRQRFEESKAEQRQAISRNEQVSQAALALTDAGVITTSGELNKQFEAALQAALDAKQVLTEQQALALVVLQGFEEVAKATSEGTGWQKTALRNVGGDLLADALTAKPKTRQIVSSSLNLDPADAQRALQENALRVGLEKLNGVLTELSAHMSNTRPVEVKVDGDVVARAHEQARDKNRRPAP